LLGKKDYVVVVLVNIEYIVEKACFKLNQFTINSKHVKPYPQKLSRHTACFNEFYGRCLISSVAKALALAYTLKKVRKSQSKELCWTEGHA